MFSRSLCVRTDGATFEGEWKDGKRWGEGTWHAAPSVAAAASSSSDADPAVRYSGSWVADKRSGFGEIQYASGASYTGTLDAEERYEGEGRYVSAEGSSLSFDYEGQWQAGVRHGVGKSSLEADVRHSPCRPHGFSPCPF